MQRLQLRSLPCVRADHPNDMESYIVDGFVDEEAITRLMETPYARRQLPYPEDLVLPAGDEDFAGWRRKPASPFVAMADLAVVPDAPVKRAKPPQIDEPGIGLPVGSGHRWWLACVTGMMATLLFSMLLLSISSRNSGGAPLVVPEPAKQTTQAAEPPAGIGLEITLLRPAGGI